VADVECRNRLEILHLPQGADPTRPRARRWRSGFGFDTGLGGAALQPPRGARAATTARSRIAALTRLWPGSDAALTRLW